MQIGLTISNKVQNVQTALSVLRHGLPGASIAKPVLDEPFAAILTILCRHASCKVRCLTAGSCLCSAQRCDDCSLTASGLLVNDATAELDTGTVNTMSD